MSNDHVIPPHGEELLQRYLSGDLGHDDASELLRLLKSDDRFVDLAFENVQAEILLRQIANNHNVVDLFIETDIFQQELEKEEKRHRPAPASKKPDRVRKTGYLPWIVGLSFVLLFLVGAFLFRNKATTPDKAESGFVEIAAMEAEKPDWGFIHAIQETKWSKDSDALRADNRIGPGRLRMLSGMVNIRFDHGVELTLEGPCQLDFKRPQRCFLHFGRVFAKVSPEATGFTIDTSLAEIKDLGTEFGVSIPENGGDKADVHVFSGRVDVTPKGKDEFVPLTTGGWLRFRAGTDEPQRPQEKYAEADDGIACSTATDRGREACLIQGGTVEELETPVNSDSRIFTLVKNAFIPDWNRKGYFAIDLSALPDDRSYEKVRLELTFAPTGVGAFSRLPQKSQFSVYGLTDESGDDWTTQDLTWDDAPGNAPGSAETNPATTVKIGSFEIPREDEPTRIVLENEALKRFLATDTNKIVTFIVVGDTLENPYFGYAHGFANKNHPELPPPTLRFFR